MLLGSVEASQLSLLSFPLGSASFAVELSSCPLVGCWSELSLPEPMSSRVVVDALAPLCAVVWV
ncbi:hypothetical protein [Actinacidiphila soli]|uniref:hypothetical protein n=1 Tax=Actinacidiphila soli TaxID=2487275 RepID=UPI000FCCA6B5|nr:hypothetical protein [Actinacidiphila soli]